VIVPFFVLFAIASMTKPVTATSILILHDEGKLSVDDPASKYLPPLKEARLGGHPPQHEVTIRDLLTHTSGVAGIPKVHGPLRDAVEQAAGKPFQFEPGSRGQYGPGMTYCGRIIEGVSGKPYEEFLRERIFQPLKMADTTFHPTPDQAQRLAKLYKLSGDKGSIEPATHWIADASPRRAVDPSASLFSTAADLARFHQAILNGGRLEGVRILSEVSARLMTRNHTGEMAAGFFPGLGWGLGWCVVREPQGAARMLSPGSFGHGGVFGTQGRIDPKRELVLIQMCQRLGFGNADGTELRAAFQELAVKAALD
jgi:CubicO group peptidase (beta-lactamase class C family)